MGNVNEPYSELVADSLEIRDEPGLQTRVEAAHWLIEEKEAWSGQDGASESNALPSLNAMRACGRRRSMITKLTIIRIVDQQNAGPSLWPLALDRNIREGTRSC